MKKGTLAVLMGILVLLGFSEILNAQNTIRTINETVYAGKRYLLYVGNLTYTSGSNACAGFSVEGDIKSWFTIENSKEQRITSLSLCVNENDKAEDWYLYVYVPENADDGEYNVTVSVIGSQKTSEEEYQKISEYLKQGMLWVDIIKLMGPTIITGETTLKIKLTVISQVHVEAESKIAEVEDMITEMNSEGMIISEFENYCIESVKEYMQEKQYREAIDLLSTLENYISTMKIQYQQAIDNLKKAHSNITELDKILFASIDESKKLIDKADTYFKAGDYASANYFASEALKEIETEKARAQERKNIAIIVLAFIVIISIIIGIVIWRNRKKAEDNKIIEESPILSPQKETIIESVEKSATSIEKESSEKKKIIETKKKEEQEKQKDSVLRKLAKQYANSEISKEEYERLKKILEDV